MTYDEFMGRPRRLHRRIMHQADDVAFRLEVCTKATTVMGEKTMTSFDNIAESRITSYIDAARKLEDLMGSYEGASDEVRAFLWSELGDQQAELLEWRYVHDKSLREISDMMGLAYTTVRNSMGAAERAARQKFLKSVQKVTEKYIGDEYNGISKRGDGNR